MFGRWLLGFPWSCTSFLAAATPSREHSSAPKPSWRWLASRHCSTALLGKVCDVLGAGMLSRHFSCVLRDVVAFLCLNCIEYCIVGFAIGTVLATPPSLPGLTVMTSALCSGLRVVRQRLCVADSSRLALQCVSGMAGVGKTTIARRYCERAAVMGWYEGGVFWANADTLSTLDASFRKLGTDDMGLPGLNDPSTKASVVRGAVLGWLQRHSKWLLVLDNADALWVGSSGVLPYLPSLSCGGGQVLVTTRCSSAVLRETLEPSYGSALCAVLRVDVLPRDDAVMLLCSAASKAVQSGGDASSGDAWSCEQWLPRVRCVAQSRSTSADVGVASAGPGVDDAEAAALAWLVGSEALGGLALALCQAGGVIGSAGWSFPRYVEEFKTASIAVVGSRKVFDAKAECRKWLASNEVDSDTIAALAADGWETLDDLRRIDDRGHLLRILNGARSKKLWDLLLGGVPGSDDRSRECIRSTFALSLKQLTSVGSPQGTAAVEVLQVLSLLAPLPVPGWMAAHVCHGLWKDSAVWTFAWGASSVGSAASNRGVEAAVSARSLELLCTRRACSSQRSRW